MPGHIHAALMAEYAKDAAETATPWERWQHSCPGHEWSPCLSSPGWALTHEYRRKPRTITVGGREIEAPIESLSERKEGWFCGVDGQPRLVSGYDRSLESHLCMNGRVFSSSAAALAAYQAVTALLTQGDQNHDD